jgi:hypothetical protein
MGVNIQPVSIWANGQSKNASELDARIIYDDLATSATFYYELKEAIVHDENGVASGGAVLSVGNIAMDNEDYQNWDDSNDGAYSFIAEKLNLTIVG